jgi:hypothetical protein
LDVRLLRRLLAPRPGTSALPSATRARPARTVIS